MARLFCSECEFQLENLNTEGYISPVPGLLGTNTTPSWKEADTIRKSLDNLDSELQFLESTISKLIARRDNLKSFMDRHRALLSPARKLFPDLLSEIFSWCPGAPTRDPSVNLPDNFDPRQGPLLLTWVSRSWRQVAVGNPKLWSTIRFVLGPRDTVDLIDTWLGRSGDSDLTIAILDRSSSDGAAAALRNFTCNVTAIRLLASQAHRWKSVFLHLPPPRSCQVYWDALNAAKGSIGRLRELTVHTTRGEIQLEIPDLFTGGPRLTSLTLNDLISGDALPIDGSRIIRFHYESPPSLDTRNPVGISECLKALQRFPNLEDCNLECILPFNDIADLPACISMSKLKRLYINIHRSSWFASVTIDPGTLWQSLHLPNLQTLIIACPDTKLQLHREAFADLLSRCPSLTTLALALASIQSQELVEVLQEAPSVKNLSLMCDWNSYSVFNAVSLTTTANTSSLVSILPRLKTMRVTVPSLVDGRIADAWFVAWVAMALSRMKPSNSDLDIGVVKGDMGYARLDSTILELRPQASALRVPLECLRNSFDQSGCANWESIVSTEASIQRGVAVLTITRRKDHPLPA